MSYSSNADYIDSLYNDDIIPYDVYSRLRDIVDILESENQNLKNLIEQMNIKQ